MTAMIDLFATAVLFASCAKLFDFMNAFEAPQSIPQNITNSTIHTPFQSKEWVQMMEEYYIFCGSPTPIMPTLIMPTPLGPLDESNPTPLRSMLDMEDDPLETIHPSILDLHETIQPTILRLLDTVHPSIIDLLHTAQPSVIDLLHTVHPQILSLRDTIHPTVRGLFDMVDPTLQDLRRTVHPSVLGLFDMVRPTILDLRGTVQPTVLGLVDMIQPTLLSLLPSLEDTNNCNLATMNNFTMNISPSSCFQLQKNGLFVDLLDKPLKKSDVKTSKNVAAVDPVYIFSMLGPLLLITAATSLLAITFIVTLSLLWKDLAAYAGIVFISLGLCHFHQEYTELYDPVFKPCLFVGGASILAATSWACFVGIGIIKDERMHNARQPSNEACAARARDAEFQAYVEASDRVTMNIIHGGRPDLMAQFPSQMDSDYDQTINYHNIALAQRGYPRHHFGQPAFTARSQVTQPAFY
mmetsp:Transcript_4257/g.9450  ORF Transcript_4257/g.9450 Transcript_4257/m.9450 type:complete len:467 (+) Transcript_4257:503-1903(+)